MRVPVRNMAGETVDEVDLRDDVFGIEPNTAVMHQAVVRQQANARVGTHSTKTRSDVAGGGAKPWRQKGTGRARQGSIRSPQWTGGGVAHGPLPRSYAQRMNRKMRRLALRSALSVKAGANQLVVMDALRMEQPRTKEMTALLDRLSVGESVLIILAERDANVERSARNLAKVKTIVPSSLSVRDLLTYDYLLADRATMAMVQDWLGEAS
ncbi:MAG: 50S ribosomal protein L4 [Chloroflexi bacterium]|nr:50S ribosomal protein L4 [Chloroflexota bacterium]